MYLDRVGHFQIYLIHVTFHESICDVIVALPTDPRDKAHSTRASSPASGSVPQISPLLRLPQNHVPQEAAKRGQEMPQSVRHGKQRPVVHPVQMEEGLLQIRRLIQSHDWRTRRQNI